MKQIPDYTKNVELDAIGEITKSRYIGTFKVRLVLTNDDKLRIERIYKEFLPNEQNVGDDRRINAGILSELKVRVIEGPTWWNGSREGRDMVEMQPLYELMGKINDAYTEWLKQLQTEADQEAPKQNV